MHIDAPYVPWDDKRKYQLFLPNAGESSKDVVLDLLLETTSHPNG
jgi:hypothetical protein